MFTGYVERNGYGPRIIVRSIKAVVKGEEVTIAYTDLLQPRVGYTFKFSLFDIMTLCISLCFSI